MRYYDIETSIISDNNGISRDSLLWAYPNPFNPSATISFNLARPQQVSVRVYNIMGQAVATVFDGIGQAGENIFVWDGRNLTGQQVAAGVYFCHLRTAESQQTLKMTVLK
jgi:flagellar hook assembly protein FlgD